MTRVVSVTCHTGAVKIREQDRAGSVGEEATPNWEDIHERTLQSGESASSITLTDTRRLLIEEVPIEQAAEAKAGG